MGALYQNVCYPSIEQARLSACQNFNVNTLSGENVYSAECVSSDFTESQMTICKRTNGGTCTVISSPWPSTPDCLHDGGVSLSYDYFLLALPVLCVIFGGKKLIQLFDHHHEKE